MSVIQRFLHWLLILSGDTLPDATPPESRGPELEEAERRLRAVEVEIAVIKLRQWG